MGEPVSLKKCKNCGEVNDGKATECKSCQVTEFKELLSLKVGGDFYETGGQ